MTSQKYEQTRSCARCGYEERRFLDELTAAFEQTREWKEPCSKGKFVGIPLKKEFHAF